MKPRVQVYLSTYNGEDYIEEQIESLLKQKGVFVSILVRDDGSQDDTIKILERLQNRNKIRFYEGKNLGYAKSFFHLVSIKISADYYAFCDQDDVWLPEKLINGIKMMEMVSADIPILYTSALQRVDRNLKFLSLQQFRHLKLTLGAEFTRHRLAGCSFVFNEKLRHLMVKACNIPELNCSHDKFATVICMACGGQVIFDSVSYILFRRHGDNISADGWSIPQKIIKDIHHFFSHKNDEASLARCIINNYEIYLTNDSYDLLNKIANYKYGIIYTIQLCFSSQLDCGFWYFNLFIKIMIILRLF
jgi:rhamnosyltransferase